jgi:hypothetical protein
MNTTTAAAHKHALEPVVTIKLIETVFADTRHHLVAVAVIQVAVVVVVVVVVVVSVLYAVVDVLMTPSLVLFVASKTEKFLL